MLWSFPFLLGVLADLVHCEMKVEKNTVLPYYLCQALKVTGILKRNFLLLEMNTVVDEMTVVLFNLLFLLSCLKILVFQIVFVENLSFIFQCVSTIQKQQNWLLEEKDMQSDFPFLFSIPSMSSFIHVHEQSYAFNCCVEEYIDFFRVKRYLHYNSALTNPINFRRYVSMTPGRKPSSLDKTVLSTLLFIRLTVSYSSWPLSQFKVFMIIKFIIV